MQPTYKGLWKTQPRMGVNSTSCCGSLEWIMSQVSCVSSLGGLPGVGTKLEDGPCVRM